MDLTIRKLRDLLVEAGVDRTVADAVRPDVPLMRQGVDSLDYPAFSLAVESHFGLTIDDRDALSLRTLSDFAAYVRSRQAQTPQEEHPLTRLRQNWKEVEPGKGYTVSPLRPGDGQGVAQLFYTIYGDRYPVEDYYIPERIEQLNADGSLLTIVARLETGVVAGQGAYFRSSPPNRSLFEFGQVMVAPEYRNSLMVGKIVREMNRLSRTMPQASGFYGEAVCTHTVTQKLVDTHGYIECGLEMSLMPAGAYEREGAGSQRVSCLLAARVDRDQRMPLHLPECYRQEMEYILGGFNLERDILFTTLDEPAAVRSTLERRTFDFAQVERVQALVVGSDFPEIAARLDQESRDRNQAVLQVFLNAGAPGTAFAVAALQARGFFLGGLMPIWFGPDGLLMQKLYVQPQFETINLYSDRGRDILKFIRTDYDRTCRSA